MTRKLLLILLLSFVTASVYAQRAGSGADQVASFAEAIEGLPTEGEVLGLPVNVHGQTTYINQRYNNFTSSYSGQNSLSDLKSMSYTWSGTLFFGARLAPNTDIYFNPEVVSGVPFSGLVGLAGFTNGEATKATGAQAKFYSARAFLRQTFNQEGDKIVLENEANQITQTVSSNRVVVTAGQFSTLDIFDDSRYAKDPRVQFMNWGNMTYLAYDYAADARGYSTGLAGEWYLGNWVMRAGRMLAPKTPNGRDLNWQIFNTYGDQVEVERQHQIADLPGKVSVLAYRNKMILARFSDATNYVIANNAQGTQAINNVRTNYQYKTGIGINGEQALTKDLGIYGRAFTSDGHTETMSFTEADNSLSVGMGLNGESWSRPKDTVGISMMQNGLSSYRKNYLQSGGVSYFIGDYAGPGQTISYRPERIGEVYYNATVIKNVLAGLNFQHINNPAYNAARGPVNILSFRIHAEF
ncbi:MULTISPECIES: carbohydrate porin [unclassified Polynucleobacter]|uniref:carbohydrate porin n=1 Tax=unclassified Polynucleobacter TaxID=2640945 RepID=UPI001BFD3F8B|nr:MULTISPECIES: carbohydrate porin [unclassified Polynucleobacter]MBU3638941.1 carbohydrate porin [Polynucleobacter sp. AP-RePozz3-80-G7]QWD82286.1 carbohydrate porin [Polynucleobacter sp. MWH-S4W17]